MTGSLLPAAEALAATLARENAALSALDLARAAGLLAEKTAAAAAFAAAVESTRKTGGIPAAEQAQAAALAEQLSSLGEGNRLLLEQALHVQGRVLDTIARALPKAMPAAPRYGAAGKLTGQPRMQAVAFSAHA